MKMTLRPAQRDPPALDLAGRDKPGFAPRRGAGAFMSPGALYIVQEQAVRVGRRSIMD